MNAINRQSNNDIPADLQPYYDEKPSGPRKWVRIITRVLAALILIFLIFLLVRWAWNQTQKEDAAKPATSASQKAQDAAGSSISTDSAKDVDGTTDSNNDVSTPATTGTTSTTASPSTGTTSSTSTTAGQSAALANTGPGQTLAVFVASSLCFALLYELRLRKQTA